MDRQYQTRYKEHLLAFKNNRNNSAFSQHLIKEMTHYQSYGIHYGCSIHNTQRKTSWYQRKILHHDTRRGTQINDKSSLKKQFLMY